MAQGFNRFYHDEHILTDDEQEKTAKVALVIAAKMRSATAWHCSA